MWSSLSLSFLICEMGPVLTVHLAMRIRDNQHQDPAQSLVHRSYPPGPERSHIHVYKWWSRIRWSFMRDERCKQSLRNPAGGDESKMVSYESILGLSLGKWAGYWQTVRGGAILHGRKAVKEGRAPAAWLSSPALLCQGLTSCPHLPFQQSAWWCFYCKSPPSLKGPWCASGWMVPNQHCLFLVCL